MKLQYELGHINKFTQAFASCFYEERERVLFSSLQSKPSVRNSPLPSALTIHQYWPFVRSCTPGNCCPKVFYFHSLLIYHTSVATGNSNCTLSLEYCFWKLFMKHVYTFGNLNPHPSKNKTNKQTKNLT